MSLFCDASSQSIYIEEVKIQEFSSNIFSSILQSKDGLKLSTNEFVLNLPIHEDKVMNGITLWSCSYQLSDFSVRVSFELKNMKKIIQKRLPDILNKEFRLVRIAYQKPKITLSYKFSMQTKSKSSKLFEKQINNIVINITEIINRIRQIQSQQQKLEPFHDLYSMKECFEFNRSSRNKSSKISLKLKKNKNVSDVLKLLAQGDTTLNKLQSFLIEAQIKKYEEQKSKISAALQQMVKKKDKTVEQSILTSIQIIKVERQKIITFSNQKPQDQLSILSTALYTFRKEITIHKQSELQSLSNEIFTELLVKKQKTEKGSNQFQNQTKFLTYLKGTYHPNIAEYFCKLQEWPFKSDALYVQHYKSSLSAVKQAISSEKKLKILHQISKVITFLNYRKICHRDLKMDNLMIDEELNVKVIDWGSVCSMYSIQNDPGALKVKDQRRNYMFIAVFSTQGYFQKFYQDVLHETFGKNYTREQIEKGEFFDIYSFGFIIQKFFDLKNSNLTYWLDLEMDYLSHKCRQKNPCDRLSAIEIQIYLTLLRKKMKKFKEEGLSSPISFGS